MYSFTFPKGLDKGPLQPSDPTTMPTYSIETKRSLLNHSRKTTELIPTSGGIGGTILWKDKAFVVGGREQKFKKITEKTFWSLGPGKHERKWCWNDSTHPYTVKYDDHAWKATPKGGSDPCVIFFRKKEHFLGSPDPANVQFLTGLPAEETVFFLLVFIFSEIARNEKTMEGFEATSLAFDAVTSMAQ